MAKICPVCGGESPDNASFCVKCGIRHEEIKQEEKTEPVEVVTVAENTGIETFETPEPISEVEPSTNNIETTVEEPVFTAPVVDELKPELSEEAVSPESIQEGLAENETLAEPSAQTEQQNEGEEKSEAEKEDSLDELFRDHDFEEETAPPKTSRYAPMSSMGTALSIIAMNIPVIGFILTIIWASGGCKKIGRRNLARAELILMVVGIILALIFALLVRFAFADAITRFFESMYPGYTITWG